MVAPTMALAIVCSGTLIGSSRPASANGVASAKAKAHALLVEIQNESQLIGRLGGQYNQEQVAVHRLQNRIREARVAVGRDQRAVSRYQATLQAAAVNAYVNSGSVASTNPLFATNANALGATSIYNQVAEGNLAGSVANFTNARQALANNERVLNASLAAHTKDTSTLANEKLQGEALQANLQHQLKQADAAVQQQLVLQQQQANAQAAAAVAAPQAPNQNFPAPPPNSSANIAVDTALSFLGVPYVWGGASRAGVDCSGLTMLSWAAAGVQLPHFSGAQMADSTPVPISDLMPGDLLFYGPGGSEHVAMYIGHGTMIEAPYTGAVVWLTPVRFGYGFAGAGRP
ncbi:MAG TPA: C40 family peptidase [Acidimicrobiales bacterium]|nr:C40 family peptidase [Acidimicrobiales bacterium]